MSIVIRGCTEEQPSACPAANEAAVPGTAFSFPRPGKVQANINDTEC